MQRASAAGRALAAPRAGAGGHGAAPVREVEEAKPARHAHFGTGSITRADHCRASFRRCVRVSSAIELAVRGHQTVHHLVARGPFGERRQGVSGLVQSFGISSSEIRAIPTVNRQNLPRHFDDESLPAVGTVIVRVKFR
jgi:hypothetical protein